MVGVAVDLANTGKVVRGLIGVFGEDLPADEAAKLNLNRNGAVRVIEVSEGLPAAKAGLRVGDIIVALDSRPFDGWADLRIAIARRKPGETLMLSYVREGRFSMARITVAARPAGS
jgi:S1-C subfamily serine protease